MIKTIICDLGNVIVFVDHKKIVQGLAKYSDKGENYINSFFLKSKARDKFDTGKITATQIFTNFKDNLNLKLDFCQFKEIWASCLINLNKDMEGLLYRLKKNYRLMLLSNTDEIHFAYCKKKYKVLEVFDNFILSYKVGHKKPNPLIYLYALKKAKEFPAKIAYIDDIKSFVTAAKFFGIKSIQYKNFDKLKKDLAKLNIKA